MNNGKTGAGPSHAVYRGANCFIDISRGPVGCNYIATEYRIFFQDAIALAGLLQPTGSLFFLIPTEPVWCCFLLHRSKQKELIELNPGSE